MENKRAKHIQILPLWAALALALVLTFPARVKGQTTQSMPAGDNDTTQRQLADMDRFLDSHPEIAEQLRKDPSLINNREFIESHPTLQQYLQDHPGVREEITENPNAFMRKEDRYDRREDEGRRGDRDTTRGELASMDRFLDSHAEIAEQLRKDPSLINNREFIASHPALQEYLQQHPAVREEFRENPNAFMRQEERYDRREDEGRRGDRDTTRAELASMDRFLDSHTEIAEQLRKDPSLINNREFIANHPALQEYLQQHPGVREEFRENPNAFMRQEERYDRREDSASLRDRDGATFRDRDRDRDRGEMGSFGDFLRGHSTVADQLSKDPSLANNREFLESHPELRDYLKEHPAMQQQLTSNPQAVMSSPALTVNPTVSKTPSPNLKPKDKQ